MQNTALATALNEKPIYTFEKAFPNSQRPLLQRIYLLSVTKNFNLYGLTQREEIENLLDINDNEVVLDQSPDPNFSILPSDYNDIIVGGRNTSLDLIRVPLAWTITRGDADILIGMSDANIDENHEDLVGKIYDIITLGVYPNFHGTAGASIIAANTNNNKGLSSVSPNSKIVFIETNGGASQLIQALYQLIHYENVKIVNCSWSISGSSSLKNILDNVIEEANEKDVLVIASAGNTVTNARYPGSYDSAISVTSVGDRVAPSYYHNILTPDGDLYWHRSWKDVHEFRPDTPNTSSHNHNDKIDITAPGQLTLSATNDYNEFPTGYFFRYWHF